MAELETIEGEAGSRSDDSESLPSSSTIEVRSNDPDDYPGMWLAWDRDQKKILAVSDDIWEAQQIAEKTGEKDPWLERAPGFAPGVLERLNDLREDESPNIVDDLRTTIPDVDEWLQTPQMFLGGKTPNAVIGTPDEWILRNRLRMIWSFSYE